VPSGRSSLQGSGAHPAAAELIDRIGWLIRLRWIAVAGVCATIGIAYAFLRKDLPFAYLFAVVGGLVVYNAVMLGVHKQLRSSVRAGRSLGLVRFARLLLPRPLWGIEGEGEVQRAALLANAQISIDFVFLAGLLHFSGGIENPFIFFFVFHGIIGSILLSRRISYIQTTFGFLLITLVAAGECFGLLPHYSLRGVFSAVVYDDPLDVAAILGVLGMTLAISVYMCSTIASRLRNRERSVVLLSQELDQKSSALEAAYERVSQSERLKSQYMRKVAHELRAPLATIQTALKVILQGVTGEIPEKTRDLVGRAEHRAHDLIEVTQDLLVLSRAREGRHAAEITKVDIDELARDVVAELGPRAGQAGVSLDLHVDKGVEAIDADATALRQLVENLVGNAVRYTPRGGSVAVEMRCGMGAVWLTVRDTGIGIPEADLPHIFEEFYRAKNARDHTADGTGLGLAIIKAVVDQHDGQIGVESTPGKGTTFTVTLPYPHK